MSVPDHDVRGVGLDAQTRCAHYNTPMDVVAIKMKCCGLYYACKDCHEELAGHAIVPWPRSEWKHLAVLCGVCRMELSVQAYVDSRNKCPHCGARFNPGCRKHSHFYFEADDTAIAKQA